MKFKLINRIRGESEVGKYEDLVFSVQPDWPEQDFPREVVARMESDALDADSQPLEEPLKSAFQQHLDDYYDQYHYYIQ